MEKKEIEERQMTQEELDTHESGGTQRLDASNVTTILTYVVKSFTGTKTQWGCRIDYLIGDDFSDFILSDWNFTSKKKYKAFELVGKKITLSPTKNEKKVLLNVLE